MRDVSCKLLSTQIIEDSIGVQEEQTVESEIPIIKVEDIYANEYYEASERGHKPNLRLRISIFNYNNQQELIYMGTTYSVIRTSEPYADEIVLICERKVKNVK